jgi:hypothetical protein
LRPKLATTFSRLHKYHSKRHVGSHKMIIRSPVLATWDIRSGNRHFENNILLHHRLQTKADKGKIRSRQDISCSIDDNLIFKGEAFAVGRVLPHLLQLRRSCLDILHARFLRWTKPLRISLPLGTLTDLGRSKSQLITENALLRKPLIILRRQVKRPVYRKADRTLLVLLARLVRNWKQALLIVQPDTLLRWHRELFHLVWKRRSNVWSRNIVCMDYGHHDVAVRATS